MSKIWKRISTMSVVTSAAQEESQRDLQFHARVISTFFMALLIISFPLLLFFCLHRRQKANKESSSLRLAPGPPGLPIIGNLHQIRGLPHRSLHQFSLAYGPLLRLRLGSVTAIVVSSPALARDIFKTNDLALCSRPNLTTWRLLSYGGLEAALSPYSPRWTRARRLLVVHFLSPRPVRGLSASREEEVRTLMNTVAAAAASGRTVNLSKSLICLVCSIMCRAVFGKRFAPAGECSMNEIGGMIFLTAELLGEFVAGDFFPWAHRWLNAVTGVQGRLERNFKEWDNLFEREIKERERTGTGGGDDGTYASVLVRLLREEQGNNEGGLTRDGVKSLLLDLMFGATGTTAATMGWAMAELLRTPRALARVQEEVRRVAAGKSYVDEGDLQRLSYLHAVVKEILRLHPVSPLLLPHECQQHCKVAGYDVAAGTRIYINAWSIGRDADAWDKPEEFRPERFEGSSVDYLGQCFELVPFGSGRRICPGISMSESVMWLTLANLLHGFDWALPAGVRREDLDMSEVFGLVASKKEPLVLIATPAKLL
ncbi:cytochrome P450 71A1-like [Zingiber officinale]|uniref:cytochrome P450 71A1-like n=1 Tax=Zingiber officinale TaxID=94328 RepID=UPI001C4DAEA0|nr:cytochrome P450 71A1-like [Zingiber officinale]